MYAKVFAQIFDSSIADNYALRHFFMDMLVLADPNGVVDMTPTAIAARTRIPLKEVKKHLEELESSDRESRTPDHDGRRIAKIDEHRSWGWCILNYDRFRKIATELQRREKTAARTRKWREKQACDASVTLGDAPVTPLYASASPSPSPSSYASASETQNHVHCPEIEVPGWDEVKAQSEKIGLVEWKARDWFDQMQSCGWKDKYRNEIVHWQSFLNRVKTWWEADGRPMTPKGTKTGVDRPKTPMDLRTIIQAKQAKVTSLRTKYASDTAIDVSWTNRTKRKEYFAIKKEIEELNNQLSNMA